jgi:ribosomal protein S13
MPSPTEADPRFNDFILLQAQNAGLFLGQIPNPVTGAKSVNLRAAKSVIDSLGMLKNKTAGNLTEHETKLIDTALKNLIPLYKTVLNDSEA